MENKKIILISLLFVLVLLGALFIVEKLSLRDIDSNSKIGTELIDLSNRSEIQEKSQDGSKQLDTILKKE